jgi:glycosyltransferase involved in cell wall biosynthesis
MAVLVDAHHIELGQTGNETWSRNVVRALAERASTEPGGADDLHVAVVRAGMGVVQPLVRPGNAHIVSERSPVRLAVDLPRVIRRVRPSSILVQYTIPPQALIRTPAVVVVHDLSFERPEARAWIQSRTLVRYRTTIRASVRAAARVVVPTDWTRCEVLERYALDEDRVVVAGNALDADLAAALRRTPIRRDPDALVVLAVGTVLPRKNLNVAAKAVVRLRARGLPAILRLVGPVPAAGRAYLAILQDTLGSGLDVRGALPIDDLAAAYRSAHVLAFPSLFEGFGIPLVEAMAAGLPIVSSDATCLPEVAGEAALYADPRSPDQWTEALNLVLTDSTEADRLAAAGIRRLRAFDWSQSARVVDQALREAAA